MLPMFVMGGACLALAIPSFFLLTESSKGKHNIEFVIDFY